MEPQLMDSQTGTITLSLCLFEDLQQTALSLVNQHRDEEAEITLCQALQGREKDLGYNHKGTLDSVHWFAVCLHNQNRCGESPDYASKSSPRARSSAR